MSWLQTIGQAPLVEDAAPTPGGWLDTLDRARRGLPPRDVADGGSDAPALPAASEIDAATAPSSPTIDESGPSWARPAPKWPNR